MGMESLFTGTNGGLIGIGRSDPAREFRDFILGAVATAGGRNTHETPLPAWTHLSPAIRGLCCLRRQPTNRHAAGADSLLTCTYA